MSARPLERWGFTIVLGLFIVAVLAVTAWNAWRSHPDDLPLAGQVVIADPQHIATSGDACAGTGDLAALAPGTPLIITPAEGEAVQAPLAEGVLNPDGTCTIAFTGTVPDAMSYTFRIDGLPELRRDQYLIDHRTDAGDFTLAPILRWD